MPMYAYRCKTCDTKAEVFRSMVDSEVPPAPEEASPTETCTHSEWERTVSGAPSWRRGDGWGGSKGNWGRS